MEQYWTRRALRNVVFYNIMNDAVPTDTVLWGFFNEHDNKVSQGVRFADQIWKVKPHNYESDSPHKLIPKEWYDQGEYLF